MFLEIDINSVINFITPYIPTILQYAFLLLAGGGVGVWLTRKKLFVRNTGEAIVAFSDLFDGATEEEIDKFVSKVKETIVSAK